MKILTPWLRHYLPTLPVDDRQLAEALTLRGIAVEGVHPLPDSRGHLFEMDITTNRVDAMNHYGIAREAATICNLDLPPLTPELPTPTPAAAPFPVRIDPAAQPLCGRFTARVLRDVTIAPSTGLIAQYFTDLGQKQISNAVDASNFTLLGMGHPTHAFDLDKIHGGITVRLAHPGEKLILLDGTERTLDPDDLVIADDLHALSLAGVMGGLDSAITPQTRNILVEAAWFDPAAIRRSSRRHGLHTDASHRFERGADFNAAPLANDLVSQLILATGGHPEGDLIDLVIPEAEARTAGRPTIALSLGEVRRHLGATVEDTADGSALTAPLVEQYLHSLGCHITPLLEAPALRHAIHHASHEAPILPEATFEVALPSWRLDLERPIDLIEEIARVFGYNRFANTLPRPLPVLQHPLDAPARAIRTRLLALGYTEAISSTFSSEADSELFSPSTPQQLHVRMENPLSDEARNLRPSLLPGMLSMLALNLNRDVPEARLFEQGETFAATESTPTHIGTVAESRSLALGLTSAAAPPTPLHSAADAPIFELKGVIEQLVSLFAPAGGPQALSFTTTDTPSWLEPGRGGTALLHNHPFATFGELSAAESARRKLRQPCFLATLALDELFEQPLRRVTAHEISRFQAAERDFSFLFPDTTAWQTVADSIHALTLPDLRDLRPLEIFRDAKGRSVPAGQYSLLLRATFQSETRTLREEDLTAAHTRILEALTRLGGTHRA